MTTVFFTQHVCYVLFAFWYERSKRLNPNILIIH